MPAPLVYSLVLIVLAYCTNALPAPSSTSNARSNDTAWSKEAILALVSVLVAILLFAVGLASKTVRRWAVGTINRTCIHCLSSGDEAYVDSLQQAAYSLQPSR